MLSIPESARIFVARAPADFRKQFDGLAAIARDDLGLDPFCGHVFVYFNKRRDRIKLLVFQHTGFWLHYKRLERGTFEAIVDGVDEAEQSVEVDARQLRLLLDGIDLRQSKFRRHFARPLRIGKRPHDQGSTIER
jgi:transposase